METLVINKKTGRIIYGIRVQENRTQAEFARKVGIDQPTISQYELGQRIPTKRTLQKIADAYHLTLHQLTGQQPINWALF